MFQLPARALLPPTQRTQHEIARVTEDAREPGLHTSVQNALHSDHSLSVLPLPSGRSWAIQNPVKSFK